MRASLKWHNLTFWPRVQERFLNVSRVVLHIDSQLLVFTVDSFLWVFVKGWDFEKPVSHIIIISSSADCSDAYLAGLNWFLGRCGHHLHLVLKTELARCNLGVGDYQNEESVRYSIQGVFLVEQNAVLRWQDIRFKMHDSLCLENPPLFYWYCSLSTH